MERVRLNAVRIRSDIEKSYEKGLGPFPNKKERKKEREREIYIYIYVCGEKIQRY